MDTSKAIEQAKQEMKEQQEKKFIADVKNLVYEIQELSERLIDRKKQLKDMKCDYREIDAV